MRSITLTLLAVICLKQLSLVTSEYTSNTHHYICDYLKLGTLEIKDNPYVKPGKRDNKNVWYQSVTWKSLPPGQVMVSLDMTLHKWGRKTMLSDGSQYDLFLSNVQETDPSFASIMRTALGIPRSGDPILGERKLDPLMFSENPCTVFYMNILPYYDEHQYTFDFKVRAKANGKAITLIAGTLIKPDK